MTGTRILLIALVGLLVAGCSSSGASAPVDEKKGEQQATEDQKAQVEKEAAGG